MSLHLRSRAVCTAYLPNSPSPSRAGHPPPPLRDLRRTTRAPPFVRLPRKGCSGSQASPSPGMRLWWVRGIFPRGAGAGTYPLADYGAVGGGGVQKGHPRVNTYHSSTLDGWVLAWLAVPFARLDQPVSVKPSKTAVRSRRPLVSSLCEQLADPGAGSCFLNAAPVAASGAKPP